MTDNPKPEQLTQAVAAAGRAKKTVRPVQREIDALPLASGDWSVAGVPGLYVRCGVRAKTFRLQHRVRGRIIWRVLGQVTVAEARRIAMTEWAKLRPKPAQNRVTLAEPWQRYVSEKSLAPKTRFLFEYNLNKYLADWKARTLEEIGEDRPGVREFFLRLARTRGVAIAHRVLKPESAIRPMRSADFRRLDGLILAGWGDICQAKIPTAVLIRALLGLPLPSPHAVGESASPPARHSSGDPRCGLSRMGVPFTDPDDRVLRRVRLPSVPIQSSPCRGHRC